MGARHAIVEEPDGSVSVAFNDEVPPPPPPPRLGTTTPAQPRSSGETQRQRVRRVTGIKYHRTSKVNALVLLLAASVLFFALRRVLDAINLAMIIGTNAALNVRDRPHSVMVPTAHGFGAFLMFVPFCVFHMWGQAAFQMGCTVMCLHAIATSEEEVVII